MNNCVRTALSVVLLAACSTAGALSAQSGTNLADLKADKLKTIYRREPNAKDLVPKVEARIAQLKADPAAAAQGARLEAELMRVEMFGAGESEARLKDDVQLLEAAAANTKAPSAEEMVTLQDRYKKLVGQMDDLALVKDFDRVLKRHDRFIKYTSLGLWDKNKVTEELQKMEEMVSSAPDIAFGKAESLRGLQERRLAAVPHLVYFGSYPHEELFLSPQRRSIGVLEETLGGQVPMETADLVIQNPDGQLVDLTTANNPANGTPFSPPLSLWMKTRILEGKVPAITFRLPDSKTAAEFAEKNPGIKLDTKAQLYTVQDVIDGKLDDYFKRNIDVIAKTGDAAIVGWFSDFDRDLAANSFGKDGRTPFYMFDPKLSKLSADEARAEYVKRTEKGAFANAKSVTADMLNQYGDPNIPDGPERVRDAWTHLAKLVGTSAPNVAFYSTAGAFHGSKTAFKHASLADAGTEAWNKLEYYWPGDGVLDWIGIEAAGPDPSEDPKGPNIADSVEQFYFQQGSSNWVNTPVMLRGVSPAITEPNPTAEAAWIPTVFQKLIRGTYPTTSIVFVDTPEKLTLWTHEANTAFRTNVSSDKFYKWPLRFKMLKKDAPAQTAGQTTGNGQ